MGTHRIDAGRGTGGHARSGFSLHTDEQRGREEPSGGGTGGQEELHVVHVNLAEHVEGSVCINKCPHASRASPPDV